MFAFCIFLTLCVELCSVFLPALQSHSVSQQVQELVERRAGTLVIIHVFLCTLSRSAVHHPYLTLEIQLHTHTYTRISGWIVCEC